MLKNFVITPPIVGRISIGKTMEKNGKTLPVKDDQFTLTTQVQNGREWMKHPFDKVVRGDNQSAKIRSIPVRMLFNDPDLCLRAEYSVFDQKSGQLMASSDGEVCRQRTNTGIEEKPMLAPGISPFTGEIMKPYGRLTVKVDVEGADDISAFMYRTTGYNSIRSLAARLRYYAAVSGGCLASLPLSMVLRAKSTTGSYRKPIYYADLEIREGMTLVEAVKQAQAEAQANKAAGLDQAALDQAARIGFAAGAFEDDEAPETELEESDDLGEVDTLPAPIAQSSKAEATNRDLAGFLSRLDKTPKENLDNAQRAAEDVFSGGDLETAVTAVEKRRQALNAA